jgi:hypothetical protein
VAGYRSDRAKQVLQKCWESAMDSSKDNPLGIQQFRTQWPWEQDRAMALYHNTQDQNGDNASSYIQLASQPERFYMENNQQGCCLSHLQKANCFISHHCINGRDVERATIQHSVLIFYECADSSTPYNIVYY